MLKNRVIPVLLLQGSRLVKTKVFKNPTYVGDPLNAIRIFNEKEVDELMIIDIWASKQQKEPNYDLLENLAGECFMPLAYAGGIQSVDQAKRIFNLGVEKVCIQTAAFKNPGFISELSSIFGSQSIMVSLDVKRSWLGKMEIWSSPNSAVLPGSWLDIAQRWIKAGAGELLLNAVHKDGTLAGPDLELITMTSRAVSVPLIACGGVSSLADIKMVVDSGASAVAAGAFFVYHGPHRAVLITYPKYSELEQLFSNRNDNK